MWYEVARRVRSLVMSHCMQISLGGAGRVRQLLKRFEFWVGARQIGPLNLWHLFTESHAGQLFLDAFPFDRVRGRAESVRQFVEFALFGFF
jgi:hypothetical protein